MTEVPEHLLKRSRDRRSALGLGGGDGGGGGDATPAAAAPADEPAPGAAVEPAAPAAAAKAAAATPATPEPEPLPPYVEAAIRRKKIPIWAMPVLAFLPVWAIIYLGGLSPADTGEPSELELGGEIYAAQCASCHGAGGGGGVGRPIDNGDLVATFPDIIGQLEFVYLGSAGTGPEGTPYGDPNREGGAHAVQSFNGNLMPAFGESLTQAELLAVVRYEREVLSGEEIDPSRISPDGLLLYGDGAPMLDDAGNLLAPDGSPLISEGAFVVKPDYTTPVGSQ